MFPLKTIKLTVLLKKLNSINKGRTTTYNVLCCDRTFYFLGSDLLSICVHQVGLQLKSIWVSGCFTYNWHIKVLCFKWKTQYFMTFLNRPYENNLFSYSHIPFSRYIDFSIYPAFLWHLNKLAHVEHSHFKNDK